MPDESLSNAAVEGLRAAFEMLNSLDEPPAEFVGVTEDFVYEDHRSGGVSFGRIGASGWPDFMRSLWGLGSGRVHRSIREVIAIEGQRSAAAAVRIDYGNDMFTEFILCLRLDPGLSRSQRIAHYDIDDVNAAIAELGQMHAEIDD